MSEEPERLSRRHPRLPARLAARLSTLDPEPDPHTGVPCFRSTQELCVDLSLGGASLETWEPLTAGRRVLLELSPPQSPPIDLIGRVAWTRVALDPRAQRPRCSLGIEFCGAAPRQLAAVERVLRRLDPEPRRATTGSRATARPGPSA